ncbi:MAG: hypothetical protein U9N04_04270 [Patescibacteria group bacterium]|nr:hypothetical protein [Patescibacteria group bacterium]
MPESNENIQLDEIKELEKKLAERKAAFEKEVPQVENREAEITKENLQEVFPQQAFPTQGQTTITDDNSKDETESVKKDFRKIKNLDTARQVEVLLALAFEKGINHSVIIARNLKDAYLLDELHDKLVGELHEELVKKGKLKEI